MKGFKKAVIIFGPPGAGKGTQAQLLADKTDFIHFDTGRYLRELLYNSKLQKNKIIKREKFLNKTGKLNTPSWVMKIVNQKIRQIDRLSKGIILSGSPRTVDEAFSNPLAQTGKKNKGLVEILKKDYGKNNILIFVLNIPSSASIKRNSRRLVCSVCRMPILGRMLNAKCQMSHCPFCGGKLKLRFDDKKEVISGRLNEYRQRTLPVIKEFKKRKYKVININATLLPYKVHQKIYSHIK